MSNGEFSIEDIQVVYLSSRVLLVRGVPNPCFNQTKRPCQW
jgi:hypothetical protein